MIISASRRTDIPAFYSKWFMNRINAGEVKVRNPFNYNQISTLSLLPENVDFIVFWTKNPKNFMPYLKTIDKIGFRYYFLFTLNPYDIDYEVNLPKEEKIIESFKKLSDMIGSTKVIWRYDPIIIDSKHSANFHIKYFEKLCKSLKGYTSECITSFISMYKICEKNLKEFDIVQYNYNQQKELLIALKKIAYNYNMDISICASELNFEDIGIKQASCINGNLIEKIICREVKFHKDTNQRPNCNCIKSFDIGAYNTCLHFCKYCYANYSIKKVNNNYKLHDPDSPFLIN